MSSRAKSGGVGIRVDYSGMSSETVGARHGVSRQDLRSISVKASLAHKGLINRRDSGELGFYNLPYDIKLAKAVDGYIRRVSRRFENFVVLGIGGSALGVTALRNALCNSLHNELPARRRGGMRLYILDNIDPDYLGDIFAGLDLSRTIFNVVTKSGSTAETISQFMHVASLLSRRIKGDWRKHILITTDPKSGPLRKIADDEKFETFPVPAPVGGRFSVLSAVGLVPVRAAGIDIVSLLAGAASMEKKCRIGDVFRNPAYMYGAQHYVSDVKKGKPILVMMPYSTKLKEISDWFAQLWAESLGKKFDMKKRIVHCGQTPVKALGVTDQHSQVQLYVEGPRDKTVTFIRVGDFSRRLNIGRTYGDVDSFSYLAGKSFNELLDTELEGTQYALTHAGRPWCELVMPSVSAFHLGETIQLFETATAFAGGLYGIDAFDQPGVETGKIYTYAMLGRAGYEKQRAEFSVRKSKK